jgi:hypothetical protein
MKAFTLLSLSAALVFVAAVPVVRADDVQTATLSPTTTDFSGIGLSVAQFNPSLGTLNSITITLTGGNLASTSVKNTTLNDTGTFTLEESTQLNLTTTLAGVTGLSETLTYSYPGLDVAPGGTDNLGSINFNGAPVDESVSSAYFSEFTGGGNVNFTIGSLSGYSVLGGGNNAQINIANQDNATVSIDYNYTSGPPPTVPEPGTLTLLGTGLLGLAGMLRRKFTASR